MKRKTVSLCMIARDEEASIGKAIKSALALVDEVVVVDTGSRDNTRIIAEGYGARLLDEVWRDDFAAARNAALAAAACDWILVLDCDEQLQNIRPVDFQRLLIDPGVLGYRLQIADSLAPDRFETRPNLPTSAVCSSIIPPSSWQNVRLDGREHGVQSRLRRLLHCDFDLFSHPRNAEGKTRRCQMSSALPQ